MPKSPPLCAIFKSLMARAAYDTTGLPNGLRTHPPRKAEVFPAIYNTKAYKPPSFVREEAKLSETNPPDVKETDPQHDLNKKT